MTTTKHYLFTYTSVLWQFLPIGDLLDSTFGVTHSFLQNGLLCDKSETVREVVGNSRRAERKEGCEDWEGIYLTYCIEL